MCLAPTCHVCRVLLWTVDPQSLRYQIGGLQLHQLQPTQCYNSSPLTKSCLFGMVCASCFPRTPSTSLVSQHLLGLVAVHNILWCQAAMVHNWSWWPRIWASSSMYKHARVAGIFGRSFAECFHGWSKAQLQPAPDFRLQWSGYMAPPYSAWFAGIWSLASQWNPLLPWRTVASALELYNWWIGGSLHHNSWFQHWQ